MDVDLQKTMDFIVEQQANFHVQIGLLTEKMGLLTEKMDAFAERAADRMSEMDERHDREISDLRDSFRRAVRLSIEEQRRERVRRQELAAAQLATELRFQKLIDLWSKKNGAS